MEPKTISTRNSVFRNQSQQHQMHNYLGQAIVQGKMNYIKMSTSANVDEKDKVAKLVFKLDESSPNTYTAEEYEDCIITCASYAICYVLNEMHQAISDAIKAIEKHPLNNSIRGFKKELTMLRNYNEEFKRIESKGFGNKMTRIKVMCQYVHEDLQLNNSRMLYTLRNWLNRIRYREVEVAAHLMLAQTIADYACNFMRERLVECSHYRPSYSAALDNVIPHRVHKLVKDLEAKMFALVPVDKEFDNADINDCKELLLGLRVMDTICLDIHQMQYYCAAGLEAEMGRQKLLEFSPATYYLIHPMEDPAYKERKAQRELEELQRQEEAKKAQLAYTTEDVQEYETMANAPIDKPLDMEAVAQMKGWRVSSKKKAV